MNIERPAEDYDWIAGDDQSLLHGYQEHQAVLQRALTIYCARSQKYGDLWRTYGWRGALFQLRIGAERAWHTLWKVNPTTMEGKAHDVDDLLDIINHAAFAIRSIEEHNRDGNWNY